MAALEQELSAIVDSHEVLRTAFVAGEGGEALRIIASAEFRNQNLSISEESTVVGHRREA